MTCSRCASRFPNPGCYVCADDEAPERDWFAAAKDDPPGAGATSPVERDCETTGGSFSESKP